MFRGLRLRDFESFGILRLRGLGIVLSLGSLRFRGLGILRFRGLGISKLKGRIFGSRNRVSGLGSRV